MTEQKKYEPGDRVEVMDGQYKGRTGRFIKYCSVVFPDYCRVTLDLKGRQRVHQTIMVEHRYLQNMPDEQTK